MNYDKKLNKKLILMFLKGQKSYNYSDPSRDAWLASVWARDVMQHMRSAKEVDRSEALAQFRDDNKKELERTVAKYPDHADVIKKELRAAADHLRPLISNLEDDAELPCGCSGGLWSMDTLCPLATSPTLIKLGEYS